MKHLQAAAVVILVIMTSGMASMASASPIVITSTLTGDNRLHNPDGLNIDVTITGDTTSNVTSWLVDLDMAAVHPTASLHEFYLNVVGATSNYSFSAFSPASWSLTDTDLNNATGSGGANFMFEYSGKNKTVTNTIPLMFTMTKNTGNFNAADFLNAVEGCSNDASLGCGQLGAHVGSLTAETGQSDSGFALGDYSDGLSVVAEAPEPASMALLGTGLLGLARSRRQARKRNLAK